MVSQRKRIKAILKEYRDSAVSPRDALMGISDIVYEKPLAPKKSVGEKSAEAFRTLMQDEDNLAVVVLHNDSKCLHAHISGDDPIAGLSDLINKLLDLLEQAKKELA